MARRRNYPVRPIRPAPPKGFDATALQVRRAYEAHYGEPIPDRMPYVDAGNRMVADLGHDAARALIQGQSNDIDPTALEQSRAYDAARKAETDAE
jgi:hypothetical protein